MVNLNQIDEAIINAFKLSVQDYFNGLIELEEDFRASLYHHLRPFIDKNKELKILLGHNVAFTGAVVKKPDILIFRKNDYLVGIELKLHSTIAKGKADIKRLEEFQPNLKRGYFIHIDKEKQAFRKTKQAWKDNYYRELYYDSSKKETYLIEAKRSDINEIKI